VKERIVLKLTELKQLDKALEVVNDCEFDSLGMLTSEYSDQKVLSFLNEEKYFNSVLENPNIKGIICTKELYNSVKIPEGLGVLLSSKPKEAFYQIHNELADREFYWKKFDNQISSSSSKISESAVIGDHSIIIGENCIIEPNVVIHPGTVIGNNVIIRSGSQVGTVGFQFMNIGERVLSVNTAGRVIIKDYVEIQHQVCVDRGVLGGDTILSEHVKVDNYVHIAHDDVIGSRTLVTAGVILGGRVTVGEDCWIGINATVSNGLKIGDNCKISLGAVVTRDVEPNSTVTGNFAIDHRKFIDFIKTIR
jgi:acetyltransferase-like isoleucine patch superfamily enzyme